MYGTGKECKHLSPTEAAYIAGVIDGEGCIGVIFRGPKPGKYRQGDFAFHISICMSTPEVINALVRYTGLGSLLGPFESDPSKHPIYRWSVTSRGAVSLAEQIAPYLQLKTSQAELMMNVNQKLLLFPERRHDLEWLRKIKQTFHDYNSRGRKRVALQELGICR